MVSRKRLWQVLSVFALTTLVLSGCTGHETMSALTPSGTTGEIQLDLIMWSFLVMMGVFSVVIAIYIYVLIRYRKRKGKDVMPKQVHGNTLLEIVWTVIPIILLALLAVPTVKATFDLAEVPDPGEGALFVKVTGYQYWWEFEYPDLGIKTAQELVIPKDTKVHFEIHGEDVLHAFWVPALGGKVDVIPGRVNTLTLDAKKTGLYHGKCAELCGAGHALMDFKVYVKEKNEFENWVAQMKQPAQVATEKQQEGEKLFQQNCLGCHAGINQKFKGPDLTKFATRTTVAGIMPNNEENLEKWLKNPESVKPGATMPKIDYLSPEEMDALIEYLMSRK